MKPTISSYFELPDVQFTLSKGFDYAESRNWQASDHAHLYKLAEDSFGAAPNFEFFRILYSQLTQYWGIGRGGGLATPDYIFSRLIDGCRDSARSSGVTLISPEHLRATAVATAIAEMKATKRNNEYPHMAASKFLHFYNPGLFPIYDGAVIWNEILNGIYKREWSSVCYRYGIKVYETSERFLLTYFAWAAELSKCADEELTQSFSTIFRDRARLDKRDLPGLDKYYASSFEYALFGAASR
jgi:hypothetical protein